MKRGNPTFVAASLICSLAVVGAALGLGALNTGGAIQIGDITLFQLGAGSTREAAKIIRSGNLTPTRLDRLEALSRKTLTTAPFDDGSWLRIVVADSVRHEGHLSQKGLQALKMSYDLIAVDNIFGVDRVGLSLEHWNDLPPDIRQSVFEEASILGGSPYRRSPLTERIRQVRNPRGRLIGELWIISFPS